MKSSLYWSHYVKACNKWKGSSPVLRTWTTQVRRNVTPEIETYRVAEKSQDTIPVFLIKILKIECPGTFRPSCRSLAPSPMSLSTTPIGRVNIFNRRLRRSVNEINVYKITSFQFSEFRPKKLWLYD